MLRGLVLGVLGCGLVACVEIPQVVHTGDDSGGMVDVDTLRSGSLSTGTMLIGPLRMTSGLAQDRLTAFAQDPVTGLGVELLMGEALDGWPPPVGTPLQLRGYYAGPPEAPVVWVSSMKDVTTLGEPEPLTVLDGADLPPALSLAAWDDVTVWTMPDPSGRAELSVRRVSDGRFGRFVPEVGNEGALTGIVLEDGSVAPRSAEDWAGSTDAYAAPTVSIDDVLSGRVEPGTYVQLAARQLTDWTVGGRYTVLQDEVGRGLWVDAEGWSPWSAQVGRAGTFSGEVEVTAGTWRLRAWAAPTWAGEDLAAPVSLGVGEHGAWVSTVVAGLQPADARGDRRVDGGLVLDDRFRPLDELVDGWTVSGVIDLTAGDPRLAVVDAVVPAP